MDQTQIDANLQKGIKAARRGHKEPAQKLLGQVVKADPSNEQAWMWLAKVVEQPEQKAQCLERVIQLNPDNQWAAQELAALQNQSAPADKTIVSAPAAEAETPPELKPISADYKLEVLNCPNCGSPLDIQGGAGVKTIVCQACGSVIDLTPEQAAVIGQASKKKRPLLPIELGATFKLGDARYQVIGWLRYEGWDDEDRWRWDEWLLASSEGEFRWLTYDPEEGFALQKKVPLSGPVDFGQATIPVPDGAARVTERAQAKIIALDGELTWRAKIGERIRYMDAKKGEQRYSVEFTPDEVELSVGKTVPEEAVWQSLGNQEIVAALQKQKATRSIYRRLALASLLFLLLSCGCMLFTAASGTSLLRQDVSLSRGESVTTNPFTVKSGRVHEVTLQASNPSDQWGPITVEALDSKGNKTLLFTKTFGDGDSSVSHTFRPKQSGQYRLIVTLKEGQMTQVNATITVRGGIWASFLFVFFIIMMVILGFIFFIKGRGAKPPYSHTLAK